MTFYEFFDDRGYEIDTTTASGFVASKTFGPMVSVIWRDMNGREGRTAAWVNLSRSNKSIESELRDLVERDLGGFEVSTKGISDDECSEPMETEMVP